jgi:hypothetical protein
MHYTLFESFLDVAVAAETDDEGGADEMIAALTNGASAEEIAAIPRMETSISLSATMRAA